MPSAGPNVRGWHDCNISPSRAGQNHGGTGMRERTVWSQPVPECRASVADLSSRPLYGSFPEVVKQPLQPHGAHPTDDQGGTRERRQEARCSSRASRRSVPGRVNDRSPWWGSTGSFVADGCGRKRRQWASQRDSRNWWQGRVWPRGHGPMPRDERYCLRWEVDRMNISGGGVMIQARWTRFLRHLAAIDYCSSTIGRYQSSWWSEPRESRYRKRSSGRRFGGRRHNRESENHAALWVWRHPRCTGYSTVDQGRIPVVRRTQLTRPWRTMTNARFVLIFSPRNQTIIIIGWENSNSGIGDILVNYYTGIASTYAFLAKLPQRRMRLSSLFVSLKKFSFK